MLGRSEKIGGVVVAVAPHEVVADRIELAVVFVEVESILADGLLAALERGVIERSRAMFGSRVLLVAVDHHKLPTQPKGTSGQRERHPDHRVGESVTVEVRPIGRSSLHNV